MIMKKRILQSESTRKNVSKVTLASYVKTLKKMVDCKTVYNKENTNKEEYEKFYKVLEEEFPKLHKKAKRKTFGSGCFVYCIEGKNPKKNIMLMSHHDVVEGDDTITHSIWMIY